MVWTELDKILQINNSKIYKSGLPYPLFNPSSTTQSRQTSGKSTPNLHSSILASFCIQQSFHISVIHNPQLVTNSHTCLQPPKMRFLLTVLFSAATFSLSGLARPPPPPSSTGPATLAKRFASGWCGVHVVQYQKNEGPTDTPNGNADYRLDVNLADALQDPVGGVSSIDAPGGQFEDIDSQLPFVFEVEVGAQDADPVRFQYNGQAWDSTAGQCSVGSYQGGSRNMDCGFNC